LEAPSGGDDVFQEDTPGPGNNDDECSPTEEPYALVCLSQVAFNDGGGAYLGTSSTAACDGTSETESVFVTTDGGGSTTGGNLVEWTQYEWHPDNTTSNATFQVDLPVAQAGFCVSVLRLQGIVGWTMYIDWVSRASSAIPNDRQTNHRFDGALPEIDEDVIEMSGSLLNIADVPGTLLFTAVIQDSTDFEDISDAFGAVQHLISTIRSYATYEFQPADEWAQDSNAEYWGDWAWVEEQGSLTA
jgi:hypothetical protein